MTGRRTAPGEPYGRRSGWTFLFNLDDCDGASRPVSYLLFHFHRPDILADIQNYLKDDAVFNKDADRHVDPFSDRHTGEAVKILEAVRCIDDLEHRTSAHPVDAGNRMDIEEPELMAFGLSVLSSICRFGEIRLPYDLLYVEIDFILQLVWVSPQKQMSLRDDGQGLLHEWVEIEYGFSL